MKRLSWTQVNRHGFLGQKKLELIQQQYSLDDLRAMLKGWSWQRVVENTISATQDEGVYFHGRIGQFLGKPCIAVCALDKIVVLRYIDHSFPKIWPYTSVIDGTKYGGFALVPSDFNGITVVKMTDLVIGADQ